MYMVVPSVNSGESCIYCKHSSEFPYCRQLSNTLQRYNPKEVGRRAWGEGLIIFSNGPPTSQEGYYARKPMDEFTGTVNDGVLTKQGACSWYLGHVEKPNHYNEYEVCKFSECGHISVYTKWRSWRSDCNLFRKNGSAFSWNFQPLTEGSSNWQERCYWWRSQLNN